jgi:hypothetical protein
MAKVKFHYEWLSPAEQSALSSVVNEAARGTSDAFIRPFNRFGLSGAKLLLVYFRSGPGGQPFIVKINKATKIGQEVKACEAAQVHFPDDTMVIVRKAIHDQMGAICYLHVAARDEDQLKKVKELKELAFALCARNSERKCVDGLDALYKRMANAHGNLRSQTLMFGDEYQRPFDYLRLEGNEKKGRRGTKALLTAAIGSKFKRRKFELFGLPAYNPLLMLDRLLQLEVKAHVGPIHGDLHTSNVVFTPDGHPRLVDFAWARPDGHILKDFVLMENSIRFMIFPGNVIHEKELHHDLMLVREDGGSRLAASSTHGGWAEQHCKRMGQMIAVIRNAAKRAIGSDWDFGEYLMAQFLVLVGSLEHYDYNFRESIRALGVIAQELWRRKV